MHFAIVVANGMIH